MSKLGFHILDIAALVVGYGMASLLIRAFWPSAGIEGPVVLTVLGLEYLWLGLAMSGPIVLYRHRKAPRRVRRPGRTLLRTRGRSWPG